MDLDTNALESKLNAVLDRSAEAPTSRSASPSLASTSSEALQYHSAVYQKPPTAEEQARRDEESERLRTLYWGDESTRRACEEQLERERVALQNLAMRGWGTCEAYEKEALRLATHRTAEDVARNISAEGYAPIWTENDQRALEFQRQKEDYLQLAERLSIFLTGDEESESEKILCYRLRNLKTLLRLYDSQWHDSFRRLREDTNKRKQRIQEPTVNGVNDFDSKVQGTFHTGGVQNDRQVTSASLGPAHSSKVSKAAPEKTRPRRLRRFNVSREVPSGDPPLLPVPEIATPASLPPRRSKRIQPSEPSMGKDPSRIASMGPVKGARRSTLRRNVTGNQKSSSSAKPQGISKSRRSSTARGRQVKDNT